MKPIIVERKKVKTVIKYLNEYKKEAILAPVFKMLEATFELLVPLVVAGIIDTGIANNDKKYILTGCFVMVLLGIVGLIASGTAQFFSAKAACGFAKKVRYALFEKLQTLSFSEIDEIGTSSLITRMTSDVNQMQTGVNLLLRLFLRSPFIVFGAMIMAFTIDFKAALVFVVTIPVLSVIVFGIMLITIPMYKKVQRSLDKVTMVTRENLTGIRVIRAFCKEDEEIERFDDSNNILNNVQKAVGKISGLMNPLTYIVINVGIIVLIYVGAVRVDNGVISRGLVIALYNYMSQILVELIKLANLIINITKSVACSKRVESILLMEATLKTGKEIKEDNDFDEKTYEYAVEFENVSMAYKGSKEEALENISFKAKKGETIGIIGGTGSGKSTLALLIPHFYDATEGVVKVNGRDVLCYDNNELRKKIGIVLQKSVLFKGTIRENLLWGNKDATDKEILDAIKIAQAQDVIASKTEGLDALVTQGGKNFSGGQRQRLAIARALALNPKILFFDEHLSESRKYSSWMIALLHWTMLQMPDSGKL